VLCLRCARSALQYGAHDKVQLLHKHSPPYVRLLQHHLPASHLFDDVQDVLDESLNGAQAHAPQQPTQHRKVRKERGHACSISSTWCVLAVCEVNSDPCTQCSSC
jgi:hypothetical protein